MFCKFIEFVVLKIEWWCLFLKARECVRKSVKVNTSASLFICIHSETTWTSTISPTWKIDTSMGAIKIIYATFIDIWKKNIFYVSIKKFNLLNYINLRFFLFKLKTIKYNPYVYEEREYFKFTYAMFPIWMKFKTISTSTHNSPRIFRYTIMLTPSVIHMTAFRKRWSWSRWQSRWFFWKYHFLSKKFKLTLLRKSTFFNLIKT